jgi:hypothetical protein
MRKDVLHQREKPYAFRYAAEEGIPQSNFEMDKHESIVIEDLRGRLDSFTFEGNGFTVLKLPREVPYEDYYHPTKVSAYFRQLEELLQRHLGASYVEVFRHGVSVANLAPNDMLTIESYERGTPPSPSLRAKLTSMTNQLRWLT